MDIEERVQNLETLLNKVSVAINDLQGGLINTTVALSTLTNSLVEDKVVSIEELQKMSEQISKELSDEYKKFSNDESKNKNTETTEPDTKEEK